MRVGREVAGPTATIFVAMLGVIAGGCAPTPHVGGDPRYQHPGAYVDRVYEDPSGEIYDGEALPRFDLDLSVEAQAALGRAPRTHVPARLTYRGETLKVGVRLRGETSFRTLADKASFRVKIDAFVPNQTLRGLENLVLRNGVQDHTLTAECLAYQVAAAAGVPAPRCNNALVWVNGEFFGVYVNVEAMDKRFLVRAFGTSKGNLYEETGADLVRGAAERFERKNHEEQTDRSDLARLIDALADARPLSFIEDVASVLDVDAFLRFAALELLVGQIDGYAYKLFERNNFLLYIHPHPHTGRFHFLPNGMDQTFRSELPPGITHAGVDAGLVYLDAENAHGLVLQTCLRGSSCRRRYAEAIETVARAFESVGVRVRAEAGFARLAPHLAADPRREVTDAELVLHQRQLLRYANERVPALRRALARGALR